MDHGFLGLRFLWMFLWWETCAVTFCDRKLEFIYIHDAHILQVDLDGMICTNDEVSECWRFWSHEGVLWLCFTYLFIDVNSGFGIVMVSLFYSMLQTFPDKLCVDIATTRVSNGARPELFQTAIWWGSLYVSFLHYNTLKTLWCPVCTIRMEWENQPCS